MPEIASTAISHIHYDRAHHELVVTFRETGTYRYFGVPEAVYDDLLESPSAGGFFNSMIFGHYRYARQ